MRAPSKSDIAAGEILLAVENVSLSFGGVHAIRDVSFDIRKGEIRAIIGPNGAGKTSMLNVINGFYHPQRGRITFQGKTRAQMRPHEAARGGIARTFQNVALFRGMSALYDGSKDAVLSIDMTFEDGRTGAMTAKVAIRDMAADGVALGKAA